jgi:hypothetical protein
LKKLKDFMQSEDNEGLTQIFTVHNNEPTLLSDWIQYHGRIFGIQNLHVIDDNSDPELKVILHGFRDLGMHLYEAKEIVPGFMFKQSKWLALSMVMQAVKISKRPLSKLLLPIDVDEFITSYPIRSSPATSGKTCSDRRAILSELGIIARRRWGKHKMNEMVQCGCSDDSEAAEQKRRALFTKFSKPLFNNEMGKTIFQTDEFVQTDQGNHHGFAESDFDLPRSGFKQKFMNHYRGTNLTIMHYRFGTTDEITTKMRRGAEAYGFAKLLQSGRKCPRFARGIHYCQFAQKHIYGPHNQESKAKKIASYCIDNRPKFAVGCASKSSVHSVGCVAEALGDPAVLSLKRLVGLFGQCLPQEKAASFTWADEEAINILQQVFSCWEAKQFDACYVYNDEGQAAERVVKTAANADFLHLVHRSKAMAMSYSMERHQRGDKRRFFRKQRNAPKAKAVYVPYKEEDGR